jgi:hypothetical protein
MHLHTREKCTFASCLSIWPHVSALLPLDGFFAKFDIGDFYENLVNPNLIKIGQKLWALYMGTYVYFIVAGNIKLP